MTTMLTKAVQPGGWSPANQSRPARFDPHIYTYAHEVGFAGGSINNDTLSILDDFVRGLKQLGLWWMIDLIWVPCGDQLAGARVLLKHPSGVPAQMAVIGTPYTEANYSQARGFTGQAGSAFNTGYIGSIQQPGNVTSHHVAAYVVDTPGMPATSPYATGAVQIGSTDASGNKNQVIAFNPPAGDIPLMGGAAQKQGFGTAATVFPPFYGLYAANAANTVASGWKDGLLKGNTGTAIAAHVLSAAAYYVLGYNNNGALANASLETLGGASIGQGFTAQQWQDYSMLWNRLQVALGRIRQPIYYAGTVGVLTSGQSLASGQLAFCMTISTTPYRGYMLLPTLRGADECSQGLDILVEAWDALNGGAETGLTTMMASLQSKLPGYTILPFGQPSGGKTYAQLAKGTTFYSNAISQATQINSLFAAQGVKFVVPGHWNVHGETDDFNSTAIYAANLKTWHDNYVTDIQAITGQTAPIPMFISQMQSWMGFSTRTTPVISQQMLAAHEANPGVIILVCPKYMFSYAAASNVHMDAAGYRWMCEYYAHAWQTVVINGGIWEPLRPLSVSRVGANITVVFSKGGLQFDTTLVTDPSGTYASKSFGAVSNNVVDALGFEFEDDTVTAASQSITGFNGQLLNVANINANFGTTNIAGDTLVVNLSGTPTGANPRLRYAFTMTVSVNPGPVTGARGCLRDNDTSFSSIWGNTLYNWCVTFDKAS